MNVAGPRPTTPAPEGPLCYCIVTYHFPPATTAGAVRAYGLARGLAQAGNEVHVFSPFGEAAQSERFHLHAVVGGESGDAVKSALGVGSGASIRTRLPRALAPAAGSVLRVAKEWAFFPDTARGWADRCSVAVSGWLATCECDVVVSSSPPVSAHVAVMTALSSQPGPLWIADWRDLWTRNPHYDAGDARARRDRRLEGELLDAADVVTVTTGEMAGSLREAYPGVTVEPVYNGYDERTVGSHAPDRTEHRLVITHAGYLYEGKRSVAPFLRIVAELLGDGLIDRSRLLIRFAGPPDSTLDAVMERLGLADVVETLGVIPRSEVPGLLSDSDVLLVVTWDAVRERSLVPAKTFEYMAAARPVLALNCLAEGELGRLLAQTGTGVCADGDDATRDALLSLYRRFEAGEPLIAPAADAGAYTHTRMAAEFDAIARSALLNRHGAGDRPAGRGTVS